LEGADDARRKHRSEPSSALHGSFLSQLPHRDSRRRSPCRALLKLPLGDSDEYAGIFERSLVTPRGDPPARGDAVANTRG
jgi:hypothetical protein